MALGMSILFIQFVDYDSSCIQVRYYDDDTGSHRYREQNLPKDTITELIENSKTKYYLGRLDPVSIGTQLYFWLNGPARIISAASDACADAQLILAIQSLEPYSFLPWECLHDGERFLVEHISPVVIPVRWIDKPTPALEVKRRRLRMLFMAAAPTNTQDLLDHEAEEARILDSTKEVDFELRVEESGCISEFRKAWERAKPKYDIFHLTAHAGLQTSEPFTPYFETEDENGNLCKTHVEDLTDVFLFGFPSLIFLSGCSSGQAAQDGLVLSFAESLVLNGAPCVVGWGMPVYDSIATEAAAQIYASLSQGLTIPESIGKAYRYLTKGQNPQQWHLLRLFMRGRDRNSLSRALVTCAGDYDDLPSDEPRLQPEPYKEFLCPITKTVRVATSETFVGRRRTLQRCIKALRDRDTYGVVLWGIGGMGKSSIAARLLGRLPSFKRVLIHRRLDYPTLFKRLEDVCTQTEGFEILDNSELRYDRKLRQFFRSGLSPSERFIFVLDDFEANLCLDQSIPYIEDRCMPVFAALIAATKSYGHKMIVTSQYLFSLPDELETGLYIEEQLIGLHKQDEQKLLLRLPSFQSSSGIPPELLDLAISVADGNPRLLENLNATLAEKLIDTDVIFGKILDVELQYRQDILAELLLSRQSPETTVLLSKACLYEIPVPFSVISALYSDQPPLEQVLDPLVRLSLVEKVDGNYFVTQVVRKSLENLNILPSTIEKSVSERIAVQLYELWSNESLSEDQAREILRFSLEADLRTISLDITADLMRLLIDSWKFSEAIEIGTMTQKRFNNLILEHRMAQAYYRLQDIDRADEHFKRALRCPFQKTHSVLMSRADLLCERASFLGSRQSSRILNENSVILGLLEEALEIAEQLDERLIIAKVKSELGRQYIFHVRDNRWTGNPEVTNRLKKKALAILHEAKELFELLGDQRGTSQALHNLSIATDDESVSEALEYIKSALDISESISDMSGFASRLHQLGKLQVKSGDIELSRLNLLHSLKIKEDYGLTVSTTANQLSKLELAAGNPLKALIFCVKALEFNLDTRFRDEPITWKRFREIFYRWVGNGYPLHESGCELNARYLLDRVVEFSMHIKYERQGRPYRYGKALALWGKGAIAIMHEKRTDEGCALLQEAYQLLNAIESDDAPRVAELIRYHCNVCDDGGLCA